MRKRVLVSENANVAFVLAATIPARGKQTRASRGSITPTGPLVKSIPWIPGKPFAVSATTAQQDWLRFVYLNGNIHRGWVALVRGTSDSNRVFAHRRILGDSYLDTNFRTCIIGCLHHR
jgi:hypothetical protein